MKPSEDVSQDSKGTRPVTEVYIETSLRQYALGYDEDSWAYSAMQRRLSAHPKL